MCWYGRLRDQVAEKRGSSSSRPSLRPGVVRTPELATEQELIDDLLERACTLGSTRRAVAATCVTLWWAAGGVERGLEGSR